MRLKRTSTRQAQFTAKSELFLISSDLAGQAGELLSKPLCRPGISSFSLLSLNRRVGALDLDVTLEIGAFLDADARRRNIADHLAVLLDLDAVARAEIAGGIAVDDHFARGNFGIQLGRAPHREPVAAEAKCCPSTLPSICKSSSL